MRVNLRRRDVGMPQHRLHGSQVGPPLQQVRGEGMSQHMRRRNPGDASPVRTRAASGITHFDELLDEAARRSPQRRTVDGCEVGRVALLLASPYASAITGEVVHVDAGFHVEGMVFH